jgi:hypothetical protein
VKHIIAKLFFLALIPGSIVSCRKETFSPTHPMVGKWELKAVVTYLNTVYLGCQVIPDICEPYYKNYTGEFTVELTESGRLIYSSRSGTETFRIVKIEERPFIVYYQTSANTNTIIGYNFTVKNKRGKRFKFKFFYDQVHQGLVGVAWYKNVAYNTFDRPIVGGTHYGRSCANLTFPGEHLGLFLKI